MKKTSFIISLFCCAFLFWAATTTEDLINGYTGAPGEGSCVGCHTYNGQDLIGSQQVSGLPQYLISDTWYQISVTLSTNIADGLYAGFQLTSVDNSGNNFGQYSSPGNNVELKTIGSRNYAQHNGYTPLGFPNPTITYTFDWKSPPVTENKTALIYYGGTINLNDGEAGYSDLALGGNLSRTVVSPVGFASINKTDVSCFNGNDGTITVFAQGGLAPVSFQWSTGDSGNTLSGLSAGNYAVTVTDELGQTSETSITLNQPPGINAAIVELQPIDCWNNETGVLNVAVNGGTSPYSYSWSNGNQQAINNNLGVGQYIMTLTDQNGCLFEDSYFLEQPDKLEVIPFTQENVSCFGSSDGLIQVSASGGTTPYFFNWSTGDDTPSISQLSAGSYSTTISDQNDCLETETFSILEPAILDLTLENLQPSETSSPTGAIDVSPDGGTPPYFYSWTGTGITNPIETEDLSNIYPGEYYLSLSDNNNCSINKGPFMVNEIMATSIKTIEQNISFSNPAHENIFLTFEPPLDNKLSYQLFDPLGKEVLSGDIPSGQRSFSIPLGNYNGLFFFKIETEVQEHVWTLIIN